MDKFSSIFLMRILMQNFTELSKHSSRDNRKNGELKKTSVDDRHHPIGINRPGAGNVFNITGGIVAKGEGQAHVLTELGARSARSASGAGGSPGVCDVVGLSPTSLPDLYFQYILIIFIFLRYGNIFVSFSR